MSIKKFFGSFGRDTFILLAFGIALIAMTASDFIVSLKPAVSFQDMLDGKEVKPGTHVAGEVVYALDYFASETTYTQYKDGSRSGGSKSGNYYLIPTATGYVGLKSRQVDVSDLNKLSEETFDYMMSGTEPTTKITMQGHVKVMEDDVAGYYRDYLEDMGYTEAEIEAFGEPLVVTYVSFVSVQVMFALGVVLILLALLLVLGRYKRAMKGSGLTSVDELPNAPQSQN